MRAMQALIDASSTSLQATFAPYLASASAMPLPMLGPTPVTSATLPASETSTVTAPSTGPVLTRLPRRPSRMAGTPWTWLHWRRGDDDRDGVRRREHREGPVANVLAFACRGHVGGIAHGVLKQPLLPVSAPVSGVAEHFR